MTSSIQNANIAKNSLIMQSDNSLLKESYSELITCFESDEPTLYQGKFIENSWNHWISSGFGYTNDSEEKHIINRLYEVLTQFDENCEGAKYNDCDKKFISMIQCFTKKLFLGLHYKKYESEIDSLLDREKPETSLKTLLSKMKDCNVFDSDEVKQAAKAYLMIHKAFDKISFVSEES